MTEPPLGQFRGRIRTIFTKIEWPLLQPLCGGVLASMDMFRATIEKGHEHVTGGGDMPLSEVVLLKKRLGLCDIGQPLGYIPTGQGAGMASASMVFQPHTGTNAAPMSTMYVPLPQASAPCSVGPSMSKHLRDINEALVNAGQQGYTFTCAIVVPTSLGLISGIFPRCNSNDTVHMVFQRGALDQPQKVKHKMVCLNVTTTRVGKRDVSVVVGLEKTIGSFLTRGWKIAGAYTPMLTTGLCGRYRSTLVLVFSFVGEQHVFSIIDLPVPFESPAGACHFDAAPSRVAHKRYMKVISEHAKVGWQVGCVLDLPDSFYDPLIGNAVVLKMIMQSPVDPLSSMKNSNAYSGANSGGAQKVTLFSSSPMGGGGRSKTGGSSVGSYESSKFGSYHTTGGSGRTGGSSGRAYRSGGSSYKSGASSSYKSGVGSSYRSGASSFGVTGPPKQQSMSR